MKKVINHPLRTFGPVGEGIQTTGMEEWRISNSRTITNEPIVRIIIIIIRYKLLNLVTQSISLCTNYSIFLHKITQSCCAQITQSRYSIYLATAH